MARIIHRHFCPALIAGVLLVSGVGAAAAEPSSADIQWAQTIMNADGIHAGRATGAFTAETRSALSTYQRKNGLPVTGRLDQATVAKMMAERAGKPNATVGNMTSRNSRANRRHHAEMEQAPEKPRASPSTPVRNAGGAGDTMIGSVVRSPSGSPPAADTATTTTVTRTTVTSSPADRGRPEPAASAPSPRESRAPAASVDSMGTVTGTSATGAPGVEAAPRDAVVATASDAAGGGIWTLTAPLWVHYGVFGIIGVVVLWLCLWFWLSGRRSHRVPLDVGDDGGPVRREPSFTSGPPGNGRGPRQPPLRALR